MIVLRTLIIATFGGAFCHLAGLPAPWLAGSLLACVLANFAHIQIVLPEGLRTCAFILLGIQTGAAVTPETLDRAARWPLSILALAITVVIVIWASTRYFERVSGWDRRTAFFAGMPGALSMVMLLAEQMSAVMKPVAVSRSVRLFLLIVALPTFIVLFAPPHLPIPPPPAITSPWQLILLVGVSAAAGMSCEWIGIPAGLVLGSSVAAAALGLSGLVSGAPPAAILIPANIILGVMIALRFRHVSAEELRGLLGHGLVGFLIALAIAAASAACVAWALDLPIALTLLAFAPGGLEAMTIMAFALNLDPAYVAAHQIARYIGLVLFMPWIAASVLRRVEG